MSIKKFGLIGHPLGHSISPFVHKRLFEIAGYPTYEYELLPISPQNFKHKIEEIKKLDGFNITIPYKTQIIQYIDKIDPKATLYGAVNTVVKNDQFVGYNTDVFGFIHSVINLGFSFLGADILVVGCGGTGRMMAIEAALQGARSITIAVREKSAETAKTVEKEILLLSPNCVVNIANVDNLTGNFDLLINATPVGMFPNVDACPISDDIINNCQYIFDAIYNPNQTLLVKKGINAGKSVSNGMSMLVYQAAYAQQIWNNMEFEKADIEKVIKEMMVLIDERF